MGGQQQESQGNALIRDKEGPRICSLVVDLHVLQVPSWPQPLAVLWGQPQVNAASEDCGNAVRTHLVVVPDLELLRLSNVSGFDDKLIPLPPFKVIGT